METDKFPHYSGMDFVSDNCYVIEESQLYKSLGNGLSSVEFVRAKGDKLLFVEAKSSFPNPNNTATNPEKENKTGKELFNEEISEISDKFTHSLNLYSAIKVGVAEGVFPDNFKPEDKVSLVFVLVINGFKQAWCDAIKKALSLRISQSRCMAKIWKPRVYVINDKIAANRKITVGGE